ncbi:MAG: hypothetical protein R3266_05900 [Gemmatimonadota bacterium]|nr:hypothetical protein [Gemmatimonadota bacterium]
MFLAELLAALAVAAIVVLVLALGFDRRSPWGGAGWFFLVVFLGAWAIGAWSSPIGPVLWGVSWVPFLFGALIFGLLIAALTPPPRPRTVEPERVDEADAAIAIGAFFWVFVLVVVLAIALASV